MVVATYRQGTMSELVENLRLRNLAVSFGILLLMAASIAMLLRSTRRANALAQQQLEFVAGVTHELRTPLAVIQSASQNLADGIAAGEAQTKRYGGVIHDQSKRLGDMLEQVLRFAGLSSQHGELRRAPVDVAALVDEAAGEVAIEVRCDVAAGLPQIDGDHAALLHCLRNLLGNASKHAAGAPVTVAARAADDGVEITVEDGGAGLADDDLPHIFEPFYRGARAKSDQIQGSGLGLSLVKKIVEAHGGSVRATSVGGLSIRMQLPAVKG
jgi:signal transduction histidine kinase